MANPSCLSGTFSVERSFSASLLVRRKRLAYLVAIVASVVMQPYQLIVFFRPYFIYRRNSRCFFEVSSL